jgi:hypothetical protein
MMDGNDRDPPIVRENDTTKLGSQLLNNSEIGTGASDGSRRSIGPWDPYFGPDHAEKVPRSLGTLMGAITAQLPGVPKAVRVFRFRFSADSDL